MPWLPALSRKTMCKNYTSLDSNVKVNQRYLSNYEIEILIPSNISLTNKKCKVIPKLYITAFLCLVSILLIIIVALLHLSNGFNGYEIALLAFTYVPVT